jgi:hypothetical protein
MFVSGLAETFVEPDEANRYGAEGNDGVLDASAVVDGFMASLESFDATIESLVKEAFVEFVFSIGLEAIGSCFRSLFEER